MSQATAARFRVEKKRRVAVSLWLASASLAALTACGGTVLPPCGGAREGLSFALEILRPVEPEATCQQDWGFSAGTVIEGRIAALEGDVSCRAGVPEIASVGEFDWMRDPALRVDGDSDLEGHYIIQGDECVSRLWMKVPRLDCDADGPFVLANTCVVELRLVPVEGSEAACPARCAERLEIRARSGGS